MVPRPLLHRALPRALRQAIAPQASRIVAFLAGHLGVTPR